MGYQSEQAEQQIVATRAREPDPEWRDRMVGLVRATRDHTDIRVGSSVRGAIDAVGLARELAGLRGVPATDWKVGLVSAKAALTGRIRLQESCNRTPEDGRRRALREGVRARPPSRPGGGDAGGTLSPPPEAGARRPAGTRTPRRASAARRADDRPLAAGPQRALRRAVAGGRRAGPAGGRSRRWRTTPTTRWRCWSRCRRPPTRSCARLVRRLAPRLMLDRARAGAARRRGIGRPRAVPADLGGELDLDASMDAVAAAYAEQRPPGLDELVARDWGRPELAMCLVVDRSGSMSGERLATAAVTAAACLVRAPASTRWSRSPGGPRWSSRSAARRDPAAVVTDVLALRGHGMTSVSARARGGREPAGDVPRRPPGDGAAVRLPLHRRGGRRAGGPGARRAADPGARSTTPTRPAGWPARAARRSPR